MYGEYKMYIYIYVYIYINRYIYVCRHTYVSSFSHVRRTWVHAGRRTRISPSFPPPVAIQRINRTKETKATHDHSKQ